MWDILDKYDGGKYLFPYLNKSTENDSYFGLYYMTKYALLHFNKDLKKIAKICRDKPTYEFYCARCNYTNILDQNNVNIVRIQ